MAIALDGSTPAFISAAADTVTTASFTPPAGAVLYAVAYHDTAGGNTTNTSVVTGGGLTWTIIRTRNKADSGGQNGHLQLSRAVVGSSSAITITTTGTNTAGYCSLRLLVFTGADTTTPEDTSDEGSSASNVVSMSLTTVTDQAWAWIAHMDWNTAAIPTPNAGVTTDTGIRPGGPNYTCWIAYRTAVTSPAGAVTISSSAPSSGNTNNFIAWAIRPAAGGGSTPSGTDSGTLSESAALMASIAGTDSGTLSEVAALTVMQSAVDSAVLAETAALTVLLGAVDSGTLSESALMAPLVVSINSSDAFTFTDFATNPNPSARSGLTTLTYHLNRLAGTIVGGVPSLTAVAAANVWAGTSKLSLEDALNEKAGHSVPTLDVAGALNELAGTNDLTPVDAISRIP